MTDESKRNLQFFVGSSTQALWQEAQYKRILSLSVSRDAETFCCIALTNLTDVVGTSYDGQNHAKVDTDGWLYTNVD